MTFVAFLHVMHCTYSSARFSGFKEKTTLLPASQTQGEIRSWSGIIINLGQLLKESHIHVSSSKLKDQPISVISKTKL